MSLENLAVSTVTHNTAPTQHIEAGASPKPGARTTADTDGA
jgi:hypothetical protein